MKTRGFEIVSKYQNENLELPIMCHQACGRL